MSYLVFSKDGQRILSGGQDKMVRMWCGETGKALMDPLRLPRDVTAVAFDERDDGILAVDKDETVFAWDMVTREPLVATLADHPAGYARDGDLVLEGRQVVDKRTNEVVSLVPTMLPAKASASHGNKIAIGLADGSIVIMCFPAL